VQRTAWDRLSRIPLEEEVVVRGGDRQPDHTITRIRSQNEVTGLLNVIRGAQESIDKITGAHAPERLHVGHDYEYVVEWQGVPTAEEYPTLEEAE
jgi:hypothetical protein